MFNPTRLATTTALALFFSISSYASNDTSTKLGNIGSPKTFVQAPVAAIEVKISKADWSLIQGAFKKFKGVELQQNAIEPMAQGLSGARLYTIIHGGQKYVIRLGADFIAGNTQNEINAMKAASAGDYGPYLHFCDEDQNIVILQHIDSDKSFVDVKNLRANPVFHAMGAKTLAGLHKADVELSEKTVFQWLDEAEKKLAAMGAQSTLWTEKDKALYQDAKREIALVFKSFSDDLTAVHHDPNPLNFLMNKDRAWLIDWETVSKDYYFVDLAVFSNFFMYDEARIPAFLKAYYGRPATDVEIAKLQLIRPMAVILHSFWLGSLANVRQVPENMMMLPYMELKGKVRGGKFKLATPENKFTFAASMAREGLRLIKSDAHKQAMALLTK